MPGSAGVNAPGKGCLLTVKQVALQLSVSRSLVYSEIARGRLPAQRVGTCWRIYAGDVHGYLQGRVWSPEQDATAED